METGRKRLEELIAGRRGGDDGAGGESGSLELLRLWEDGKEQLLGLVAKDGQVFSHFFVVVHCTLRVRRWRS